MSKKQNLKRLVYLLLTLFLLVFNCIGGRVFSSAYAETSDYTGVLEDLRKDSSFNFLDYPEKSDDYSIQVIQVAESVDGELFIYTYQPCQNTTPLTATEINMSLTDKMGFVVDENDQLSDIDKPRLYGLTFINSWGVFVKYKVNGLTVSNEPIRYYNITSIYRDWIKGIDDETGNDNITNDKYFDVRKLFRLKTVNGDIEYLCKTVDVVEIKNPYADFLSYRNGMTWASFLGLEGDSFTDVHYIAFSTDKQIDTLKEADVTYTTQSYKKEAFNGGFSYGEVSDPQYKTLTGDMGGSTGGFLVPNYSWKCIQTSGDFIKNTNLNEKTAETVKKTDFVLVFLTTPYTEKKVSSLSQGHSTEVSGVKVSNVSILRLEFESNGKVYNLGALMNKQEGDNIPGNLPDKIGFFEYVWRCIVKLFSGTASIVEGVVAVVAILVVVVLLPVLLTVLSFVFPAFGAVMKTILRGLWKGTKYFFKVLSLPFKAIGALFRKDKE